MWDEGVRFVDRESQHFYTILDRAIMKALDIEDQILVHQLRPWGKRTLEKKLRCMQHNCVNKHRRGITEQISK